jgi:hypothetical protein
MLRRLPALEQGSAAFVNHRDNAGPDGPPPEYPIWELAEEISTAIGEWPGDFEAVRETVDQIVTLTPDPDEDMEGE